MMSAHDNENNNNRATAGNIYATEIMASNPSSAAATSGVGLRTPFPTFTATAMNVNPFLSQQNLLRRQGMEMPAAASSASVVGLPTTFPYLGHNNAEMEIPRHIRPMEANTSHRGLFAAAQNNASMVGNAHYNPFNPESIEEIVAVQEQKLRRREMELLLARGGLSEYGHQLGGYAVNLLPRAHQNHSFAHLFGSAPVAASSGSQLAASLTNHALGGLSEEAAGMVQMSERNHSNNEYYSQMLQRQNHLDQLMRLQQFDVSGRLHLGHVAAPVLGQAFSDGINRFQPSINDLSPNTSSSTSNINLPATTSNVNPSIQKILVHDKLRYFNNGVEVDINGNPLPKTSTSFENPMADANNFKALQDNRIMSLFVDLVLSQIPEMSHIMARYLTSLNTEAQQQIDRGVARADKMNKNLSSVIDMALAELKSIDQDDLNAIDPKCSDLAVRVAKCIDEIEAFKEKHCESSSSPQSLSQPNTSVSSPNQEFSVPSPNQNISVSSPNQGDQDKEKSNKKTHRNEDDLPLMQVYKRSKKSAKKATKSKAKNVTADSNMDKRFKRPEGLDTEERTSPRVVLNSALAVPNQQTSNPIHNKASTVHSPDEKNPTKSTKIENSAEPTKTAVKGPHGDLLGLLFSTKAPTFSSLPTLKKDPVKTVVDSAQTQNEDSGDALKKDASDDELSVAGVLLGLGK